MHQSKRTWLVLAVALGQASPQGRVSGTVRRAEARLGEAPGVSKGGGLYTAGREPLQDFSQGHDLQGFVLREDHSFGYVKGGERLGIVGPFKKLFWLSSWEEEAARKDPVAKTKDLGKE